MEQIDYHRILPDNVAPNQTDFPEIVSEVYQNKILSNSQRKGMIRLIFKKTDRTDLKYHRPISPLNVDVNVIIKTLAHRLLKVKVLKELEKEILDFVWANKKHEISKDLLMSDISCGGLTSQNTKQNKCTKNSMGC